LIGEEVSRDKLSIGDLVFFRTYARYPSHVGIYIGNDKFIHASSKMGCIAVNDINQAYYKKRYLGARRVLPNGYAE
jgi:cell wall-associated NlpC family hydrolase